MSEYLSKRFDRLVPYTPGEQPQDRKFIKLNTNECPYPPSQKVQEAVRREASMLNLYSDPTCGKLNEAIAKYYGVEKDNVITANGSDEILAFLFLAFCDKDIGAIYPNISYGFYSVYADMCCIDGKAVPLKADFTIDPEDYFDSGRTVFIANPNAPTGISLSVEQIESIVKRNEKNVVVIDEAYVDFGGKSAIGLLKKYNNLAIVRTFSKSRNMAGSRLGYCIASRDIIADMNTIKFSFNPYNCDRLALAAGKAAIEDDDYFKECTSKVIKTRENTVKALKELGFTVLPSDANFVFAKQPGTNGKELYLELKERGILVRHFDKDEIKDYLRITIGTDDEMAALINMLKEIGGIN